MRASVDAFDDFVVISHGKAVFVSDKVICERSPDFLSCFIKGRRNVETVVLDIDVDRGFCYIPTLSNSL